MAFSCYFIAVKISMAFWGQSEDKRAWALQLDCVWNPVVPFSICATIGKFLILSVLQISQLRNEAIIMAPLFKVVRGAQ